MTDTFESTEILNVVFMEEDPEIKCNAKKDTCPRVAVWLVTIVSCGCQVPMCDPCAEESKDWTSDWKTFDFYTCNYCDRVTATPYMPDKGVRLKPL